MHGRENMQHEGPPFPFILEVRSERSPNCLIESNRTFRDLDTYQHILTLLLNGRLRYAHWSSDRIWVSIKREQKIDYHLLYSGFDIGESGRVEDFPQRKNAPATKYSGHDYYNHLWGQDKELLIPDSLDDDLEIIHNLSNKEMTKLRRAVYWHSLGIQYTQEQSLATLAFSTAIECLLPSSLPAKCPTCKKPTQGTTQLFKKLIKRYGTIPESLEKARNKLYDIRSALVHGSHATKIDTDFFSSNKDDHMLLLEIVAQRSLIGWIRDSNRSTWYL
jgi:Apea-like HEPN